MFDKFVKIANVLDRYGHYDEADFLDKVLSKYAQEDVIEIPSEEKEMLDLVLKSLQDSLQAPDSEEL